MVATVLLEARYYSGPPNYLDLQVVSPLLSSLLCPRVSLCLLARGSRETHVSRAGRKPQVEPDSRIARDKWESGALSVQQSTAMRNWRCGFMPSESFACCLD